MCRSSKTNKPKSAIMASASLRVLDELEVQCTSVLCFPYLH